MHGFSGGKLTALPITYPTHCALFHRKTKKVTAVMDCFSGKVLRVFNGRFDIGSKVETGAIVTTKSGEVQVEKKFWIVIGYSSWQAAKAMVRKVGPETAVRSLQSGVWHEVISE